jgi:prolyl oligopeptidase
VPDGFRLPEAKSSVGWIDRDHLFVATSCGPGTTTLSGYPRQIRRWARGTELSAAEVVFEGQESDVSVWAHHDDTPGFERDFVGRSLTFFTDCRFERTPDGRLVKVDKPDDVDSTVVRDQLLLRLRSPWTVDGVTYPAGALLAAPYDAWMRGERPLAVLFAPTAHTSLESYTVTRNHLLLALLDDVRTRIEVLTPSDGGWKRETLPGLSAHGSATVAPVDERESDDYWLMSSDFLTPSTLARGRIGGGPAVVVKSMPALFSAEGLAIHQHFATSTDGTRIPYFQVSRAEDPGRGDTPTLLTGYGGFEISLRPFYSGGVGAAWLERGGAFVVANIRGGAEYGPTWHQAALRERRPRAYEDFAAVAAHLVERGVTRPARLGAMGGSNGGLLVGNMLVRYPERFGAIVCQVPLLDMQRYHRLLAGASWMEEYGDPDDPLQWEWLREISPFHQLRADQSYPRTLFVTSTRDDRVHPGHARKMAARMAALGHDFLYYENTEGGHGAAADHRQQAHLDALTYTFLWSTLGGSQGAGAGSAGGGGAA